jgi:CheY-like chemotaxis protein
MGRDSGASIVGPRRVIVVDDGDASRASLCEALKAAGYEVAGASSALGVSKLAKGEEAVIVCDVSPPITFEQVTATARSVREVTGGKFPIVITGTQPRLQLGILARACRAVAYIGREEGDSAVARALLKVFPGEAPRPSNPGWTIIKLLLIDDSEITLQLMQRRLRAAGFDVRIAVALGEVHAIVKGWSPNVIVADVQMPEMRGDELCTTLKATVTRDDVLIVLCSSIEEKALAELAEAAGADGFVSKSLGLDHFVDRIQAVCRRLSDPIISIQ